MPMTKSLMMINNELMKNKEYQELLIQTFNIEDCFEGNVVFTEEWIKFFKENSDPNASADDFDLYRDDLEIFERIEFLFMIDNQIIGIYNNKYVVSFHEGNCIFTFGGDTES